MKSREIGSVPQEQKQPQEPVEQSIERLEGETPVEHFERLRKISGSKQAKISRGEADSGAVKGGKRIAG